MVTSLAAAGQLQFKPKLGVFYMLAAISVLGSTDAIVKWSSGNIDPIQIGFSRFVVSLIMVLWLVGRSQPGFAALRTKRPLEHAARAFCAAVELTAFYYAISKIPLPTAMSVVAASPIFGTHPRHRVPARAAAPRRLDRGVRRLRRHVAGGAARRRREQPGWHDRSLDIGVSVVLRPAVRAAAQHHREQLQHPVLLRDRRRHHPRPRDAVRAGSIRRRWNGRVFSRSACSAASASIS